MSETIKVSSGPRNEAGDVDCKFYSIQRFINLAAQGQPSQLEMLFAPDSMVEQTSIEWQIIKDHRNLFLSTAGINPFVSFVGFALAQAHKTCLKGDNFNRLRDVLAWGATLTAHEQQQKLSAYFVPELNNGPDGDGSEIPNSFRLFCETSKAMTDFAFELKENDHHFSCLWISNRQYDPGAKTKTVLKQLQVLVDKYGTRSKAAAEFGLDYKSLMHAYRLLGEAEEFLATGNITLPRPAEEIAFLKRVRNMELPVDFDWMGDIEAKLDHIRQVIEPKSPLPTKPDWSKLGELCRWTLRKHMKG
jgi:hypothetical protein